MAYDDIESESLENIIDRYEEVRHVRSAERDVLLAELEIRAEERKAKSPTGLTYNGINYTVDRSGHLYREVRRHRKSTAA